MVNYTQSELDSYARMYCSARDVTRDKKLIHGSLMGATWGVIIVVGAFVARYQKHTRYWVQTHRILQLTSMIVSIPLLVIAINMVNEQYATPHAWLGTFMYVAAVAQSVLGTLCVWVRKASEKRSVPSIYIGAKVRGRKRMHKRETSVEDKYHWTHQDAPHKHKTRGLALRYGSWILQNEYDESLHFVHRWLGRAIVITGAIQIFLGIDMFNHEMSPLKITYAGWFSVLGAVFTFKELERYYKSRSSSPDNSPSSKNAGKGKRKSDTAKTEEKMKAKTHHLSAKLSEANIVSAVQV